MTDAPRPFVGRAGAKLDFALDAFELDVRGLRCADFGCNVGGFTDCLLRRGAASVVAMDTGHGVLDWRLRNDPRVTVRERTNALHAEPTAPVDLVVVDLAWTRQRLAIPAALRWLDSGGRIVTLLKPHYEAEGAERKALTGGALPAGVAHAVAVRVATDVEAFGVRVRCGCRSPLIGGKSGRRGAGNAEFLLLLELRDPAGSGPPTSP